MVNYLNTPASQKATFILNQGLKTKFPIFYKQEPLKQAPVSPEA